MIDTTRYSSRTRSVYEPVGRDALVNPRVFDAELSEVAQHESTRRVSEAQASDPDARQRFSLVRRPSVVVACRFVLVVKVVVVVDDIVRRRVRRYNPRDVRRRSFIYFIQQQRTKRPLTSRDQIQYYTVHTFILAYTHRTYIHIIIYTRYRYRGAENIIFNNNSNDNNNSQLSSYKSYKPQLIPLSIRLSPSIGSFKRHLKIHLFTLPG